MFYIFQQLDARIILVNMYEDKARRVFCEVCGFYSSSYNDFNDSALTLAYVIYYMLAYFNMYMVLTRPRFLPRLFPSLTTMGSAWYHPLALRKSILATIDSAPISYVEP